MSLARNIKGMYPYKSVCVLHDGVKITEGREKKWSSEVRMRSAASSRHDVLRRSDGVVAIARIAGKSRRVARISNKAARSVSRDDADLIDSDIVAVADGISRHAETFDIAQIVPGTIGGDPHAVGLRSSDHDHVGGPVC